ncbi:PREDICTED: tensin-4 isoform X2 [Gekko japonicus]|uniref:Tensin-4 isoform X2 n=1 Tax=Gekko japonicus TaxID=146911 RepID=A0ABM1KWI3_GEKJA|nr:PREDICTED: tensin-4 isoform X2 [Gekko japonicus]
MSKVIPSHVVRVGQTICVSSQEEQCLHKHGCSPSHALPTKYFYYSTEGLDRRSSLAQTRGCSLPKTELFSSWKPSTETTPMMRSPTPECLQEEPLDTTGDTCPFSPTLDISIENLNRLILEIDPTFQPLQLKPGPTQTPAHVIPCEQKHAPDSPDIKYIEMSPTRTKCTESLQNSASPSGTPLSVSPPNHNRLLLHRQSPVDNSNLRDHTTSLCSNNLRGTQHFQPTERQSPVPFQASASISIPKQNVNNAATSGSNSILATSPGFENFLKPSQFGKIQQRCSEASVLSTSPGSDTSYILGSTQSLPSNEPDTPLTRSMGSHSSVGSMSASSIGTRGSEGFNSTVTSSPKVNSPVPPSFQKGHTPPAPLSPIANSAHPTPILLVNGCLEHGEMSAKPSKVHQGSFQQKIPPPSSGTVSGIGSPSKTSSESSLTSLSSGESCPREAQTTMKFVLDTSKYWFKPSISRDQAVQLLMDEPPGTFIMRDSTSFRGSFGLAMKVSSSKTGEDGGPDGIRHFLIESSTRGVHLKGADEEPYFGSLSAFVYQHTIMPLALPCKLVIPSQDFVGGEENLGMGTEATLPLPKKAAVCNLLYLRSVTMETLTGKAAVQKAVSSTFELETPPTPTVVHFKVTEQGITLTDIQRKVFFRRHYPLATISFCDLDPENRKWQKFSRTSRIFGVVAKSPADSENICHIFAEYDPVHPASHIVDFVKKILPAA